MNDSTDAIIPAVDKAVAILRYLGGRQGGASQAELSEALSITSTTCYRILQSLLRAGFLHKTGGSYDLGGGILAVVQKLNEHSAHFACAQPILYRLAEGSGLSTKLSIRQGEEQLSILRSESPLPMSVTGKVGSHFPLIEGSVGAALLADTPEREIRTLAKRCRTRVPEQNHPELILAGVQAIREHGYCLNAGQNRWHVEALSVPVRDKAGTIVAALTLLGTQADFAEKRLSKIVRLALRAAPHCAP